MQNASSVLRDAIVDPAVLVGTALSSAALLSGFAARVVERITRRR